jgi:hypothetical protein
MEGSYGPRERLTTIGALLWCAGGCGAASTVLGPDELAFQAIEKPRPADFQDQASVTSSDGRLYIDGSMPGDLCAASAGSSAVLGESSVTLTVEVIPRVPSTSCPTTQSMILYRAEIRGLVVGEPYLVRVIHVNRVQGPSTVVLEQQISICCEPTSRPRARTAKGVGEAVLGEGATSRHDRRRAAA